MAARRGTNGRFATAGEPGMDPVMDLPPLVTLTVDPVDEPRPELVTPLPEPEYSEPSAGAPAGDDGAVDGLLADALAAGLDELVGMMFGAEYRASAAQVEAVGEAAYPVLRRVLSFVHAGELAESTVPAPIREVATLAARMYAAWGDAAALIFQRKLAEIREARSNDPAPRSTNGADEHARAAGRANGHGNGAAAAVPADRDGGSPLWPARPANGAESPFDAVASLYPRARGEGPGPS